MHTRPTTQYIPWTIECLHLGTPSFKNMKWSKQRVALCRDSAWFCLVGVRKTSLRWIQIFKKAVSSWWFQPLWKICSSKWESSPSFGVNIKKNLWNHHLEFGIGPEDSFSLMIPSAKKSQASRTTSLILADAALPPSKWTAWLNLFWARF